MEVEVGCIFEDDAAGDDSLELDAGFFEEAEDFDALGFGCDGADVNVGLLEVGGDVHGADGDEGDWEGDFAGDGDGELAFEDFADANEAVLHGDGG